MNLSRAGRRTSHLRVLLSIAFALAFILSNASRAVAGTTGVLSGVVTDAQSHAPLANVRVTAAAPTGRYTATTGPNGFYSITGIYADTYVVSFELPGYESVSVPGISVFADQTQRVGAALTNSSKRSRP